KSYRKVLRLCFSLTTLLKNFSPTCCFFSLLSFSMGITFSLHPSDGKLHPSDGKLHPSDGKLHPSDGKSYSPDG
ncbi:MAG: hypothetical protein ACYDCN_15140, partial [Bacteroidia bacterium]